MRIRYHFALEVKRLLSDDEKDELRDELESEASVILADLFDGDSGDVSLKFCGPPATPSPKPVVA